MKNTFFALPTLLSMVLVISSCAYPRAGWEQRPVSYYKPGLWHKSHLTWRLNTLTPIPAHLSEQDLQREIAKSFKCWEPGGVFTFSPSSGGRADVVVGFDAVPGKSWDGRLGVMAEATNPSSARRGHIYLDPSEWWTTKSHALLADPIVAWLPRSIGNMLGLQYGPDYGFAMTAQGPYGKPGPADFDRLRELYAADNLSPTGVYAVTDTSGYRFSAH